MSQIRIKKYDIDAGEKLSGKRIVFLSDFHEAKDGELNDAIISAVKKASPDVVLLGGDMINGRDMFIEMEPAINLINALAEHFPVYYSFGNHERKIICNIYGNKDVWETYLEALDDRVKFLRNAHEEIMDGLDVYGIDIALVDKGTSGTLVYKYKKGRISKELVKLEPIFVPFEYGTKEFDSLFSGYEITVSE